MIGGFRSVLCVSVFQGSLLVTVNVEATHPLLSLVYQRAQSYYRGMKAHIIHLYYTPMGGGGGVRARGGDLTNFKIF